MDDFQILKEKYKQKVREQLGYPPEEIHQDKIITVEYKQFKKEVLPAHFTLYEQFCNFCERYFRAKPDAKNTAKLNESIYISHLNITPSGAQSFALVAPLFSGIILGVLFFALLKSFFFLFFFLIAGVAMITPISRIPHFFANNWRMKASNQMVLCIFYVVTYMRHTSNIEGAIRFASEHLSAPLSLDLKKVLWDVETEKYESVIESLEVYLGTWKNWNNEFIESFHLVESSLYEGYEEKRLAVLDKALDVMLDETYERMLHYAHDLKSPIEMLHMLGIILPILGLVVLPLVVSFLENVTWYHIALLYNFALPVGVYYIGKNILSKRPTGYGQTDISQDNPEFKKYKNILITFGKTQLKISPIWISIIIFAILFLIGVSPLLIHLISPDFDIGFFKDKFKLLNYKTDKNGNLVGPFGFGAGILSLFVTASIGIGIGSYYKLKSKNIIKIRERAKKLELEFASALFQLANRLSDGIPAEMAVAKVANSIQGTISGNFFEIVSNNIRKLGMSVKQAIFHPKLGALVYFPSKIIESSMKVLIQSVKKGPLIASQALMNISRYIKEIHRVNERLKDLMADIISSMTSQIKFLTPVISGIVVGITSMITTILVNLKDKLGMMASEGQTEAINLGMLELFGLGLPTYYFQLVVGIYVVEIIIILTILTNGIQNGSDKLNEQYELGKNLQKSTILYCFVTILIMTIFNFIAAEVMTKTLAV